MRRLKCRVGEKWTQNRIEILLYEPDFEGGIKAVMLPLYLENQLITEVSEGMVVSPTLSMPRSLVQSLVDELYKEFKIIPSQLNDKELQNGKELTAIKYHLEDMRKLVFKGESKEELCC